MKRLIVVALCVMSLSGCSAIMALHGQEDANTGALRIGQHRQEVILNLGQPEKTSQSGNKITDYFRCQTGNSPSAGRAIGHIVMDLLTFGWWEIIGVPVEAMSTSTQILIIEYENAFVSNIATGTKESLL